MSRDKGSFIAKEKGWKKNPKMMERNHIPPQAFPRSPFQNFFPLIFPADFYQLSGIIPSFPWPHPCWEAEWEERKAPCCAGSTAAATTPNPRVGKGNSIPGRASVVLPGPAAPSRGPEGFSFPDSIFPEPEKAEFQVLWDISRDFVDGEADLLLPAVCGGSREDLERDKTFIPDFHLPSSFHGAGMGRGGEANRNLG